MFTLKYEYSDGTVEYEEEMFETEEEASEYGLYMISCNELGAEILNMSNPGDYPLEEAVDLDFEVIEVE